MRFLLSAIVIFGACSDGKRASQQPPAPQRQAGSASTIPTAGAPVQPGTIKAKESVVTLGIVVPAGGDGLKLEKLARERGIAADDIVRAQVKDLGWNRDMFTMFASKLPAADQDAILAASSVLGLALRGSDGYATYRKLAAITSELATAAKGWVFDDATLKFFTAAQFADALPGDVPDVRNLIAIHAVGGEGEPPYSDTAGMRRLGLPNLFIKAIAPSQVHDVTSLLNATAQTLLIDGDITRPGEISIDFGALGAGWGIDDIRNNKGSGKATWRAHWAKAIDHGDEGELVIELEPAAGPGAEGIAKLIDECFGPVPDEVHHLSDDDPELLEAAKRARRELAGKRSHFAKGVPYNEQLSVKAPFKSSDGRVEWMWVDVVRWRGDKLTGSLDNDPIEVTTLKRGQTVTVAFDDVADFFHRAADGTSSGGYSVEVARKRGLIP